MSGRTEPKLIANVAPGDSVKLSEGWYTAWNVSPEWTGSFTITGDPGMGGKVAFIVAAQNYQMFMTSGGTFDNNNGAPPSLLLFSGREWTEPSD